MPLKEGSIFGACNPLLDISAHVDCAFLEKYGVLPNSAILAQEKHEQLYEDLLVNHEIEYIPGGSGQNTLRTASWILQSPNVATFMGCIGQDKNADIMKEKAKDVGLNAVYQVDDKAPTGRCAVLITGNNRSLVAQLGAANHFTTEHLDNENNWSFIENAKIYYISGFFFTVCPEAIMRIAKYSNEQKKTFAINLSAPFISDVCKNELLAVMPYVDMVFGNDDESMAFSKNVLGTESTDIKEIAQKIALLPKINQDRKRTVIITRGDRPVIVADHDSIHEYPVKKLEEDQIVDTNGAGDAFVGGFLAQFVQDKAVDTCVDCGIWASSLIIQRNGCTFPETMDYVEPLSRVSNCA